MIENVIQSSLRTTPLPQSYYAVYEYGWPFVYFRSLEKTPTAKRFTSTRVHDSLDSVKSEFLISDFNLCRAQTGEPEQRFYSSIDNWSLMGIRVETQFSLMGTLANLLIFLTFIGSVGIICEWRERTVGLLVFRIKDALVCFGAIAGILAWAMFHLELGRKDERLASEIRAIALDETAAPHIKTAFILLKSSKPVPFVEWESKVPGIVARLTDNRFQIQNRLAKQGMKRIRQINLLSLNSSLANDDTTRDKVIEKLGQLSGLTDLVVSPGKETAALFKDKSFVKIRRLIISDADSFSDLSLDSKEGWSWLKSFRTWRRLR